MQINFNQVEALLRSFLTRADFAYPGPCPEADAKLYQLAIEESIRRGINKNHENTKPYFGPILFNAAQYTNTSYADTRILRLADASCVFLVSLESG
jgi:hypothetical protein